DFVRVRDAVEIAAVLRADDELRRDARVGGDLEGAAGAVGDDDGDRQAAVGHRLQDGSTAGREDTDPHIGHPTPGICLQPGAAKCRIGCMPATPHRRPSGGVEHKRPTTGELVILLTGAVMLFGTFLDFAGGRSVRARAWFPLAALLPIYGVLMALQVAVVRF